MNIAEETLPVGIVYVNKQNAEKYEKQPLLFLFTACGILRGLDFHRRAQALFYY